MTRISKQEQQTLAKFMPPFDGPYKIIASHPESSTYTLDLPTHTNIHPTFHISELRQHIPNDASLYPSRKLQRPGLIVTMLGAKAWEIEHILDKQAHGRGCQYLIHWHRYGSEADAWLSSSKVEGCDTLQEYEETSGVSKVERV